MTVPGGGGSSANSVHFNGGGSIKPGAWYTLSGGGSHTGKTFSRLSASAGSPAGQQQPALVPGRGSGMAEFDDVHQRDVEFAVGSVCGLRMWSLKPPDFRDDPLHAGQNWPPARLIGATGYPWPDGVLEAQCGNGRSHAVPTAVDPDGCRCGCGIWAYWDMAGLSSQTAYSGQLPVLGTVEGYGRVLLGTKGFRCQRAKITALAPAFSVQAYPSPGDLRRDEFLGAQRKADAWMAVIMDRLGMLYPGAAVYATVHGLLASVPTVGKPS